MKRYIIFTIIYMAAVTVFMIAIKPVVASASPGWIETTPTFQIDSGREGCHVTEEQLVDGGAYYYGEPRESVGLCVVHGKDVDFGYLPGFDYRGARDFLVRMRNAVKFSYYVGDANVHNIQLIPNTNSATYIRTGYYPIRTLMEVNDITTALIPNHLDSGNIFSYTLDKSAFSKMILPSASPQNGMEVSSYRVSRDGRYVIAYVDNGGIAKVDLQTNQTTSLLVIPSIGYGGASSWVDAVSDDSRFVFVGPSGLVVDTRNCGDVATYHLSYLSHLLNPCPSRNMQSVIGSSVQYQYISEGLFGGDGSTLQFTTVDATSMNPITHEVVMETSDVQTIRYLALGDSYSSGEGDVSMTNTSNYLAGTENQSQCHLSYRSYPFLLRSMWGIDPSEMRSVACSGAKINSDYLDFKNFRNNTYKPSEYLGQLRQQAGQSGDRKTQLRTDALNNFTPGIMRQIDFVAKYKPDIVTFTGGGNDVGFGDILGLCASPLKEGLHACAYVYDKQLRANLNKSIDDQYLTSKRFIEAMQLLSPQTKIYLVGYPQFVASNGICLSNSMWLDDAERSMIRAGVSRLNNILKRVAHDTGVYYVDIEDSLEGGQICQVTCNLTRLCQASMYMTGPVKLGTKLLTGYTQESYHPNADGHQRIADTIYNRIKNSDLAYTIIDIPDEQNGQRVIHKAVTKDYTGIGSTQMITVEPGIFQPDGTVTIEMFSTKVTLASKQVAPDGSVNGGVTIPDNIEAGQHLLTITGQGVDGDTIQIQQVITIEAESGSVTNGDMPDTARAEVYHDTIQVNSIYHLGEAASGSLYGEKNDKGLFTGDDEKSSEPAIDRSGTKDNPIWITTWVAGILIIIGVAYVAKKRG